jgi:hypothetical protein
MKPSEYFGCATGDCPHKTERECVEAVLQLADDLHDEIAILKADHDFSVEAIEQWKTWHRKLADVLGLSFVEVSVTLAAVRRLVDEQRKAERAAEAAGGES